MLVSLIIVFREAMEAGLIVGIVLAATQGIAGRGRWIAGGHRRGRGRRRPRRRLRGGVSDAFEGAGQEVFTASILCFAVIMLSWHILWMSHHARVMAAEFRQVGQAVRLGQRSLAALGCVVAIAVLREGAEVVLFLYGIVAGSHTISVVAGHGGGVAGLALAVAMSWLLYRGLVAIPVHRLFKVTNGLIALLAAGMAGQAAATLHSADLLPAWGEHLWDTSALLADDSIVGQSPARFDRIFRATVGHTACGLARHIAGAGDLLPGYQPAAGIAAAGAAALAVLLIAAAPGTGR